MPLTPTLRGEGSFAALLQRRSGTVFGDEYDHEEVSKSSWRTRPLPSAARACLVSRISSSHFLPSFKWYVPKLLPPMGSLVELFRCEKLNTEASGKHDVSYIFIVEHFQTDTRGRIPQWFIREKSGGGLHSASVA